VMTSRKTKSGVAVHGLLQLAFEATGKFVVGASGGWASQCPFSERSRCRRSLSERLSDSRLHRHISGTANASVPGMAEVGARPAPEEVSPFLYLTAVTSQPIIHKKVPSPLTPEILNGLGR
jgi:hypothetical protein